jgi:hypothetical protein
MATAVASSTPALAGVDLPSLRRHESLPRPRALVLVDPDGAFAATLRRPLLVPCLVFAALLALLPPLAWFVAASRAGGVDVVLVEELKRNGRLDRVPPNLREQVVPRVVQATKVVLPLAAVGRRIGWIVACGLVCFAVLRASRPQARAAVVVACAAVGAAPLFVADVIAAAVFLAHDVRSIDVQTAVGSNPVAWLASGKDAREPWAVALQGFDLFELWACAWMAAGIARGLGGRTTTPWFVVFGLHVIVVVVAVVRAAFS